MMAIGNPSRPQASSANDWTARLPPGSPSADPGMAVQPYANPGYGMPNAYVGNLNQSPGMAVGGYLLANQLLDPNQGQSQPAPQNRLAPWSNWEGDGGAPSNDYWLEQARRLVEPLPGISSGAPPKPWGLNRDQPTWNERPAYGPGGRSQGYVGTLQRIRPIQEGIDPGISLGDETIPGTRSPMPVIMQQRPGWKYRET